MKQLKKLTRTMKERISKRNLNPDNWRLVSSTQFEFTVRNSKSGKKITIQY